MGTCQAMSGEPLSQQGGDGAGRLMCDTRIPAGACGHGLAGRPCPSGRPILTHHEGAPSCPPGGWAGISPGLRPEATDGPGAQDGRRLPRLCSQSCPHVLARTACSHTCLHPHMITQQTSLKPCRVSTDRRRVGMRPHAGFSLRANGRASWPAHLPPLSLDVLSLLSLASPPVTSEATSPPRRTQHSLGNADLQRLVDAVCLGKV